ncbi:hypothetical protein GGR57DRAFT_272763 [Xylariaceae sp. FL1272]|nr:hypothetical protein GGR57DRAFT_272763 [Xylariaceae sp. FL1272]
MKQCPMPGAIALTALGIHSQVAQQTTRLIRVRYGTITTRDVTRPCRSAWAYTAGGSILAEANRLLQCHARSTVHLGIKALSSPEWPIPRGNRLSRYHRPGQPSPPRIVSSELWVISNHRCRRQRAVSRAWESKLAVFDLPLNHQTLSWHPNGTSRRKPKRQL